MVTALAFAGGRAHGESEGLHGFETVLTVPAAAAIAGVNGAWFRSDLWLFNRSYSSTARLGLRYRPFRGQEGGVSEVLLTLAPRRSTLISDVVGALFERPGTAGVVEIARDPKGGGPISGGSRVYASTASGTFGTPVPALASAAARTRALFVGLANGGPDLTRGYRSNAGAYNPGERAATVTFRLQGEDGEPLGSTSITLDPFEAVQLDPNVFALVGAGPVETENASLVVTSTAPVFSYVTVIDNTSGDALFLSPDADEASLAGAWTGSFDPHDYFDCDGNIPADATFEQDGEAVVGILNARGGCGFSGSRFTGKLVGDRLTGTVLGGGFGAYGPGIVEGGLSADKLELVITVDCPGVLCIPGGGLHLHR